MTAPNYAAEGLEVIRPDIAEMFAELSGYEEYKEATYDHLDARRRAKLVENTRLWRARNPRKQRDLARRSRTSYRKRHPEKRLAEKARHREKHRTKLRAAWRRSAKAYRARKRAARIS